MPSDGSVPVVGSDTSEQLHRACTSTSVVCPDTIGIWRLRKSKHLDDARWHLDFDRKRLAAHSVAGARVAHREVMRILAYLRAKGRR